MARAMLYACAPSEFAIVPGPSTGVGLRNLADSHLRKTCLGLRPFLRVQKYRSGKHISY
jgi:hypothetical protein